MITSYKIYSLGCKVNQYDGDILNGLLKSSNLIKKNNNCDIAIINTCAVTKTAIHKAKRMINKARSENPNAKIIIIGCWTRIYEKEVDRYADLIITEKNPEKILHKILKTYNLPFNTSCHNQIISTNNKSRYFIKIQDGCEQFCSYCIIPYSRGKLKSRNSQEILNEINAAIQSGYREIVLSGIHLGLYGKEKGNIENINLVKLIKKILKIEGLGRIRLSSIEVSEVTLDLIKLIKANSKICKHLHIPLQSGCDKILKLMNRPYNLNFFINKIKEIKKDIPRISITTDVIVGFPNENDKDFNETFENIKKIKFSMLHVFPFSAHEETPAYKMNYQIDKKTKSLRSKKLRILSNDLTKIFIDSIKERRLEVIIENIKNDNIKCKTEYYFDINIKQTNNINYKVGKIIEIENTLN